jgi:hypothetical protein
MSAFATAEKPRAAPPSFSLASLPLKIGADATAAVVAACAVAPIVGAIDKAVAQQAGGAAQLWPSFFASLREIGRKPAAFVRSPTFLYVGAMCVCAVHHLSNHTSRFLCVYV